MRRGPSPSAPREGLRPATRVLSALALILFLAFVVLLVVLLAFVHDGLDYHVENGIPEPALPSVVSMALACLLAAGVLAACAWASRRRGGGGRSGGEAVVPVHVRGTHFEGRGAVPLEGVARAGVRGLPFAARVSIACLVVFALQVVLVWSLYGRVGWDVGWVNGQAIYLAGGVTFEELYSDGGAFIEWYYDTYTNNAGITMALVPLARLALAIGVNPLLAFGLVAALSVNLGGLFATLFVRRVGGSEPASWVAFGLYALLFSLSPWVCVAYTDTYACCLVGAALYLGALATDVPRAGRGVRLAARDAALWLLAGLAALLGYLVKPTVLIVLVAVVLAWLVFLPSRPRGTRLVGAVGAACGLGLAAALVLGVLSPALCRAVGVDSSTGRAFSAAHFFMMGQNDATTGVYSQDDVDFSALIADYDERRQADLERGLERIAARTLLGNVKYFTKKVLLSYGDGSFCWGLDAGTNFYDEIYPTDGELATALRSVFYRPEWQDGASLLAFRTYTQVVWYVVLVLWCVAGAEGLVHLRRCARGWAGAGLAAPRGACGPVLEDSGGCGRSGLRLPVAPLPSAAALVPMLTIMGVTLYLMLFEDRARYLYCFGPVLVACAALGVAWASRMVVGRRLRQGQGRTSLGRGAPGDVRGVVIEERQVAERA